jgi:hypothetical protein
MTSAAESPNEGDDRRDASPAPKPVSWQDRLADGARPADILEELFATWTPRLMSGAIGATKDRAAAEDIVQDVFVRMVRNFGQLAKHPAPDGWILVVFKNLLIDHFRAKGRQTDEDIDTIDSMLLANEIDEERRRGSLAAGNVPVEDWTVTWVGNVEPILAYLRVLVARGDIAGDSLESYFRLTVAAVPQRELAAAENRSQSAVSVRKTELQRIVRLTVYLCEILGLVDHRHRAADIRSHLDLFETTAALDDEDRQRLRTAGSAITRGIDGEPLLRPDDAQAAIAAVDPLAGDQLALLHQSETDYADALGNPTPTCIQRECELHTSPVAL